MRGSIHLLFALLLAAPLAGAAVSAANPAEAVVLKDFQALSSGDAEGLAAVFAPEFQMHRLPTEADTLTGPRSDKLRTREQLRAHFEQAFVTEPPALHEVVEMVSLGDLVVAHVAIHAPDGTLADHALVAFRVRNDLIVAIWHIAAEENAAQQSSVTARAVVERREAANNRGDADAFLALYDSDAKLFHYRRDPAQLGGGLSKNADRASRERFFRNRIINEPSQVEVVDSAALGEWVAYRNHVSLRDGTGFDDLSIVRVRNGLITHSWYLADAEPRRETAAQ